MLIFSGERFSRKVFIGGLPPDIDEGKIYVKFWLGLQKPYSGYTIIVFFMWILSF